MTLAELIAEHKAQLGKVAARFEDVNQSDFKRHLARAGYRLCTKYPLWKTGEIALAAGVDQYPAPADMIGTLLCDWGRTACGCRGQSPWDDGFVGYPPSLILEGGDSAMRLRLSTPPTASTIGAWGSTLRYRYLAAYQINEQTVNVGAAHIPPLLLAALIEAMRELSAEMTVVQLQKGLSGLPTAGMPAYLYEKLCQEFDRL